MFFKMIILSFVAIFLVNSPSQAGTSVGHGGTILREYVEESRNIVAKVIKLMKEEKKAGKSFDFLCRERLNFTDEQIAYCHRYIDEVSDKFVDLVTNDPIVDFKFSDEVLKGFGPNGTVLTVDAVTYSHDREDPIYFNFKRIQWFTPKEMLFMWFHELGHKIVFDSINITDYDPIGPFKEGHTLLDAAANSLSQYAEDRRLIGDQFYLLDNFACEYKLNGDLVMKFEGVSQRVFISKTKDPFQTYYAGFDSKNPFWKVSFVHPETSEEVFLRLHIFEDDGCNNNAQRRKTSLYLIRVKDKKRVDYHKLFDKNPICKGENQLLQVYYNPTGQKEMQFNCKYLGSFGLAKEPEINDLFSKKL